MRDRLMLSTLSSPEWHASKLYTETNVALEREPIWSRY